MRKQIAFAMLAAIVSGPLRGQLHLITGAPTPNWSTPGGYPTLLYRIGLDGSLERVTEILPADSGSDWIAASSELRRAVIIPRDGHAVPVVDFNTGGVSKSCKQPPGWIMGSQCLMNLPGRGPVLAADVLVGKPEGLQLRAMSLDPDVPCEKSFFALNPEDVRHEVADGYAGVGATGWYDSILTSLAQDGEIVRRSSGITAHFGIHVPLAMLEAMGDKVNTSVLANNERVLVLRATKLAEGRSGAGAIEEDRLLALRKSDRTWHRVPDFSNRLGWGRAFGEYLAITAAYGKGASVKEGPGRQEWRTKDSPMGPAVTRLFSDSDAVFPGRLHLYNVETEKSYSITTNQADSEVLLIDQGVAYYRVSDRIYSVSIGSTGLGEPKLCAKADSIRDAHWAFVKR
jgi:hypothetical protein